MWYVCVSDLVVCLCASSHGPDAVCARVRVGQLEHRHRHGRADVVEIRTTFPNRTYADDDATLQACGLCPNALLLVRPVG